ncbi:MAG: transcriptional regulator [Gemmatimonas sp.]
MSAKTQTSAQSIARAAMKADRAREGARAMEEYVDRRAQAVAKTARLRAQRLAQENALEQAKKPDKA